MNIAPIMSQESRRRRTVINEYHPIAPNDSAAITRTESPPGCGDYSRSVDRCGDNPSPIPAQSFCARGEHDHPRKTRESGFAHFDPFRKTIHLLPPPSGKPLRAGIVATFRCRAP